jgi:ribosome-binding protein aMBF1 (putative translation factor)
MSGHRPFKHLSDQLRATPEGRAAVEQEREIVRDMLALHTLREARGMTQVELARAWDTSQTNVSRVEHERDIY